MKTDINYQNIAKLLYKMGYKSKKEYMVVVAPLTNKKKAEAMIYFLTSNPNAKFQEIVDKSLEIAGKD